MRSGKSSILIERQGETYLQLVERNRGSSVSRTLSPKILNANTETVIARPGKMALQGALSAYSSAPPRSISFTELLAQLLEQIDNLGLNGHVQGRDGLVADNEGRLHGERPGDTDALTLTIAHFVRIALGHGRTQPADVQQVFDALATLWRPGLDAVHPHRLGKHVADLHTDLPHPDSPTMATVSPSCTSYEMPSTALRIPLEVTKTVCKSRLSKSVAATTPQPMALERCPDTLQLRDNRSHTPVRSVHDKGFVARCQHLGLIVVSP